VSKHLGTQRRLNPCALSSASEAEKTFVALHLALPKSEKLLNSIKEWGRYGVFDEKGFKV